MKKQLTAIILTVLAALSGGMTTLAAPELVNAGGEWLTFDSEYYAENNPDIVALVGTDADALLQHYLSAGQYEGRLCCAPLTQEGTARVLSYEIYGSNPHFVVVPAMPGERPVKIIKHKDDGTIRATVSFTYDSKGNLVRKSDSLTFNTVYEYDNHGNLTSKGYLTKDGKVDMALFYDSHGILTKMEGSTGVCDNIYDNAGKLIEEIEHKGNGRTYRMKYSYDEEGKLVGIVGGYDGKEPDNIEIRRYNDMGKVIYIGVDMGLEPLPFPGFDQEFQASMYYEFAYDELGRLIKDNGSVYEYDSYGNVVKITHTVKNYNDGWWDEYIYE